MAFKQQCKRQTVNFQPSSWSYDFMESIANQNNHLLEVEEENVKKMEWEIRRMLDQNEGEVEALELVNDIDRLGLGYKFEEFINRCLERVKIQKIDNNNLHASALYFRLLRQHGHHISTDIFEKFMNDSSKRLMESDGGGMLSLYEASYLAFDGENILEDAREFTRFHLNNIINKLGEDVELNKFVERVRHALELPLHHRMPRLEARWNIEMYECGDQNQMLLHKLAILDFNRVQSLHQLELQEVATWWRGLGLGKKLSFARDRVMECFFWSVGMVFEPEFSQFRVALTKVGLLITVLDDIYDVYGTPQELEQFTQAVQKWDMNCVNHLPDYMKLFFFALHNTVNDLAYQTLKDQHQLIINHLTTGWTDLCKSFLREAKWGYEKEIPEFDEYMSNGWISSSGVLLLTHAYFFIAPTVTDEGLQNLNHLHASLRLPSTIFRLANDLASPKEEIVEAVSCYMQETGSSEEAGRAHVRKLIHEKWKEMNKEITNDATFGKNFIRTSCNLARIALCQYQHGDAHTQPSHVSTNQIKSVIVDPIQLIDT